MLAAHKSDVQESVTFSFAMIGGQMSAVLVVIMDAFSSSPPMTTRYPQGNLLFF
jgi:hypothetical protein